MASGSHREEHALTGWLFRPEETLMMYELTDDEIDQVHGGVAPLAIAAVAGVGSGIAYWRSSNNPNALGLTAAVLYGGLGGAIGAAGKVGSAIFGSVVALTGNELALQADKSTNDR